VIARSRESLADRLLVESPAARMKTFSVIVSSWRHDGRLRGNFRALLRLVALLAGIIGVYSVLFHLVMVREGQTHSWLTGFYWTMVTMSTLGFGDITFQSDLGRLFSVLVLTTGTIYLLVLLPFTFIQFFYAPWLEARDAARAPRELAGDLNDHVLLAAYGPIEVALVQRLRQFRRPFAVIVPAVPDALRLHDDGVPVMVGDLDDPDTYRRARADRAALVAATLSDTANTNIAFTVREVAPKVPIIATAAAPGSVDILQLAGCDQVLQPGELLGGFMARRVYGGDGRSHVVGQVGPLLVAEATATRTALVGRSLRELNLPERVNVNVAGVWERGRFLLGGPDTVVTRNSVLLLAGTREQLDHYDRAYSVPAERPAFVLIIGAGRVGRAAAKALAERGVEYRVIERSADRLRGDPHVVRGDAADLAVLQTAGLERASCAIVTTHDDDVNVYLTLYCRRLKPDLLILSRATLERNTTTLHRAGADVVLSLASIGAHAIFNMLRRSHLLLLAEGLDVFSAPLPRALENRTLGECGIRQDTGCNLLAVQHAGGMIINPDVSARLPPGSQLILMGDRQAEQKFFEKYGGQ
jgi:Trk K+ transport system NAD-binding subunit